MSQYKYILTFPDGHTLDSQEEYDYCEDGVYDSYDDAEEAACNDIGNYHAGAEVLHMSNPGDYPSDGDSDDVEYDIEEI